MALSAQESPSSLFEAETAAPCANSIDVESPFYEQAKAQGIVLQSFESADCDAQKPPEQSEPRILGTTQNANGLAIQVSWVANCCQRMVSVVEVMEDGTWNVHLQDAPECGDCFCTTCCFSGTLVVACPNHLFPSKVLVNGVAVQGSDI